MNLRLLYEEATNMVFNTKENVMKMTVDFPDHYEIKTLTSECAHKISTNWPYHSDGSVKFLSNTIARNPSAGIFHKNGELAAWCLQHDIGSLLALHTDKNHLRQGLGTTAVKVICKKIAETNDTDVQANCISTNVTALQLFGKLGFRIIDKNFWMIVGR